MSLFAGDICSCCSAKMSGFGRDQCYGCNPGRYACTPVNPTNTRNRVWMHSQCDRCHTLHVRRVDTTVRVTRFVFRMGQDGRIECHEIPDVADFIACSFCDFKALSIAHVERHIRVVHPTFASIFDSD